MQRTNLNSFASLEDIDPIETQEWIESLEALAHHTDPARAAFILKQLEGCARHLGLSSQSAPFSAYQNTIALGEQAIHPGDVPLEERITALIRWNALVMVVRANRAYGELGGHIASYASAAEIFEIGFNHFFRGPDSASGADLVFSNLTPHPGYTLGHSWKAGWTRHVWPTFVKRSRVMGYLHILIPG